MCRQIPRGCDQHDRIRNLGARQTKHKLCWTEAQDGRSVMLEINTELFELMYRQVAMDEHCSDDSSGDSRELKKQKRERSHKEKKRHNHGQKKKKQNSRYKDEERHTIEESPRSIMAPPPDLLTTIQAKAGLAVVLPSPPVSPRMFSYSLPSPSGVLPSAFALQSEATFGGEPLKPGLNISPRMQPASPSSPFGISRCRFPLSPAVLPSFRLDGSSWP